MKGKVKSVTVTYPENMDELRKGYSEALAKVIIKMLSSHQIDELINKSKNLSVRKSICKDGKVLKGYIG